MLSKMSAILLGIFAEKELSAYELLKLLQENETMNYYPMGESSVYAAVKKLEKDGMIEGVVVEQEKMPSKKVFKITEKGNEELNNSALSYLDMLVKDGGEFEVGVLLLNRLKKDEIMKKLKNKLHELEKLYFDLKKTILFLEQNRSLPFTTIAVLKHRRHLIEAERKTINELIRELNTQRGRRSAKSFYDFRMEAN